MLKKRTRIVILTSLCSLLLVSCGGGESHKPGAKADEHNAAAEVESQPLPLTEVAKLEGRVESGSDSLVLDVYNGSAWDVESITFRLVCKSWSSNIWNRVFVENVVVSPRHTQNTILETAFTDDCRKFRWLPMEATGRPASLSESVVPVQDSLLLKLDSLLRVNNIEPEKRIVCLRVFLLYDYKSEMFAGLSHCTRDGIRQATDKLWHSYFK